MRERLRRWLSTVASNVPADACVASKRAPLSVHSEHCVHQRIAHSSCQRCEDACPRAAWSHDGDGLSLDTDACDDCGQCVAACPHEALAIPEPIPHVVDTLPRSLMVACERVAGNHGAHAPGRVACLHAISPDWVIHQAGRHHCAEVQMASADCSTCDRAPRGQTFSQRWQAVAQRLGSNAPRLARLSPAEWLEQTSGAQMPNASRRRLFDRLLAPRRSVGATSDAVATGLMTSRRSKLVLRLSEDPQARLKPTLWQVEINPHHCTACMACVRLCPQQALKHIIGQPLPDGRQAIALHQARCTGCGLCTDVCEHAAIAVHEPDAGGNAVRRVQIVALEALVCVQCKAPFQLPLGKLSDNTQEHRPICPICRAGKPHHTQRIVQAFDASAVRDVESK